MHGRKFPIHAFCLLIWEHNLELRVTHLWEYWKYQDCLQTAIILICKESFLTLVPGIKDIMNKES